MFRAHSTFFGFLTAAAALGIAGLASAWSWNEVIYILGTPIVFVLAARVFAGYAPVSFRSDEEKVGESSGDEEGLDRYSRAGRLGIPASNNELLASAYAEAQANGMTGDALRRFEEVARRVDEDERGDPQSRSVASS